jgi:chromosome segregation ATPase
MREFLKGLELDQETIDTIMAEYGKNVTMFKEKLDEYKEQVSNYENQVKELNGKIESDAKSLENLQTITSENKDLKTQLQMSDSNVKKEFMKFVTSEISSRVNDDTDFATALNDYKKENPQYFGDTVVKKVQTSPSLNTGGTLPQSTNEIMNDILRGAVNE